MPTQALHHCSCSRQFPTYWYATPALLKHWLDTVLQRGFAEAQLAALPRPVEDRA